MVVPVPPLVIPRVPETSAEPRAILPLLRTPLTDLTGPEVRVDTVVEPLVETEKMELPLPFLRSNTAKAEAAEEVAWITTGMVVEETE